MVLVELGHVPPKPQPTSRMRWPGAGSASRSSRRVMASLAARKSSVVRVAEPGSSQKPQWTFLPKISAMTGLRSPASSGTSLSK